MEEEVAGIFLFQEKKSFFLGRKRRNFFFQLKEELKKKSASISSPPHSTHMSAAHLWTEVGGGGKKIFKTFQEIPQIHFCFYPSWEKKEIQGRKTWKDFFFFWRETAFGGIR